jgi:hypothetical protein
MIGSKPRSIRVQSSGVYLSEWSTVVAPHDGLAGAANRRTSLGGAKTMGMGSTP